MTARTTPSVPLWLRGLLAVDRLVMSAALGEAIVRDELVHAVVPPAERATLTEALYTTQSSYLPGGRHFDQGLFAWEEALLARAALPPAARILVGGAGGGREVAALLARGHRVLAFDPCPAYAPALAAIVRNHPESEAFRASFESFTDTVDARRGAVYEAVARAPIDAIVLGWASLSHLLSADARLALFTSLRRCAPLAPLLVSFAGHAGIDTLGHRGRLRATTRRLLGALGAAHLRGDRELFFPRAGFLVALDEADLAELGARTSYRVDHYGSHPNGHALLRPV